MYIARLLASNRQCSHQGRISKWNVKAVYWTYKRKQLQQDILVRIVQRRNYY